MDNHKEFDNMIRLSMKDLNKEKSETFDYMVNMLKLLQEEEVFFHKAKEELHEISNKSNADSDKLHYIDLVLNTRLNEINASITYISDKAEAIANEGVSDNITGEEDYSNLPF